MADAKAVSLKPSDMVAGGLLNDVTVEWAKCRFILFDYGGKSASGPAPAFSLEGIDVDTNEEASEVWTVGKAKDWEPSSDGKYLVPVGAATALNNQSKWAMLVTSLLNAGFPEDKIEDDISVFDGMVAHMMRVPAPKSWSALSGGSVDAEGNKRERTILVVDEIIKLPWEKKKAAGAPGAAKAKAKPKAKPKAKAPATEEDTSDIDAVCTEFVMEQVLAAGDDGIAKKELTKLAFENFKGNANQNAIVQRLFKDEFLATGPWTVTDGIVSMG